MWVWAVDAVEGVALMHAQAAKAPVELRAGGRGGGANEDFERYTGIWAVCALLGEDW